MNESVLLNSYRRPPENRQGRPIAARRSPVVRRVGVLTLAHARHAVILRSTRHARCRHIRSSGTLALRAFGWCSDDLLAGGEVFSSPDTSAETTEWFTTAPSRFLRKRTDKNYVSSPRYISSWMVDRRLEPPENRHGPTALVDHESLFLRQRCLVQSAWCEPELSFMLSAWMRRPQR
jgi:hypothetical protein